MAETTIPGRLILKHDTPANWEQIGNQVLDKGELIIYDTVTEDDVTIVGGLKIGDGVTSINDLPLIYSPTRAIDGLFNTTNQLVNRTTKIVNEISYSNGKITIKRDGGSTGLTLVSASTLKSAMGLSNAEIKMSEFIKSTHNARTNAWTGITTDTGTTISEGKQITYYLQYANEYSSSTPVTLTLTNASGREFTYNVSLGGNIRVTNEYKDNSVIHMTYINNKGWIIDS